MIDTKLSPKSKIIAAGWSLAERIENDSDGAIIITVDVDKGKLLNFRVRRRVLREELATMRLDAILENLSIIYDNLHQQVVAAELIES